jgi:hypothetical protein
LRIDDPPGFLEALLDSEEVRVDVLNVNRSAAVITERLLCFYIRGRLELSVLYAKGDRVAYIDGVVSHLDANRRQVEGLLHGIAAQGLRPPLLFHFIQVLECLLARILSGFSDLFFASWFWSDASLEKETRYQRQDEI